MPKGPHGEKRPADAAQRAHKVFQIAVGEDSDTPVVAADKVSARKGGLKGGKARAAALTPRQRSEIASVAAQARWKKP